MLEAPDGQRVALPVEIYTVLLNITKAMAEGRAVTIAPHEQVLSTQQAANLLGVSRSTFVAILERGEIPYTQPGRRRVRLTDVLDYQGRQQHARGQALDSLTREAEELLRLGEAGLYRPLWSVAILAEARGRDVRAANAATSRWAEIATVKDRGHVRHTVGRRG